MAWVKLDDNCVRHPKVAGLSDGAFRLWITGLCYCQEFLTDGHIDDRALKSLSAYSHLRLISVLDAGLWLKSAKGGVEVHDYLAYQPSRAEVTQRRDDARIRMSAKRGASSQEVPANNERTSEEVFDPGPARPGKDKYKDLPARKPRRNLLPVENRKDISFKQLCAVAKDLLTHEPTFTGAEWKARIREVLAKSGFTEPPPEELTKALDAVEHTERSRT
jgi:hypothetical protein